MAAHPDMKACGGITARVSPQTVTDVKTFDVASYEEDIGGVSIDFCLSETDDEDYFLLEHQEEELPALPQQQAFSRPSRTFLPPILEERRVAFAAQHVVMQLESDGCSFEQRYVHQVLDSVQVWFIPHHTAYSKEERSCMWYSKSELAVMRERAMQAKKSKRRNSREFVAHQELEQCSLFAPLPPKSNGYPTKTFGKNERSVSERRARYEAMIDAVLIEQYEQRAMCLRLYGRVESGFTGILDVERLAEIYTSAGKTNAAMERALEKAQLAIAEINMDDEEDELSTSTRSTGSKRSLKPPKLKRTTSFNASACKVETAHCLDQGIGSVFQALISPLIEIRKGDLFLEVGEEMSIEL